MPQPNTRTFAHITFSIDQNGRCDAKQYIHEARHYRPTARLAHLQAKFGREMRRTMHEHITHPLFKALDLHHVLENKPKNHMSVRLDNGEPAILERTTFFRFDGDTVSAETFLFDVPTDGAERAARITAIQERLKDDLEAHDEILLHDLAENARLAQEAADKARHEYESARRLFDNHRKIQTGGQS